MLGRVLCFFQLLFISGVVLVLYPETSTIMLRLIKNSTGFYIKRYLLINLIPAYTHPCMDYQF